MCHLFVCQIYKRQCSCCGRLPEFTVGCLFVCRRDTGKCLPCWVTSVFWCRVFVCPTDAEQRSYLAGWPAFFSVSYVCLSYRCRTVVLPCWVIPVLFFLCRMFLCQTDTGQYSYHAGLPVCFFWVISVCLSDRYWTELLPCWVTGGFFVISVWRQILDRTLTVLGYWWVFCDICLATDTGQNSYHAGLLAVFWCRLQLHGQRPGRTPASWCPGSSHSVPWWPTCRK